MSKKGLLKQKRRGEAGALRETERATKFAVNLYDSRQQAPCQDFKLSVDSMTRIAFLAGDLGCFYLRKCPRSNGRFNPAFNELYFKACDLLTIEDSLLRRAAELELLEAGQ